MFKRFPASFRTFWALDGQNRMKNDRVMAVFQFFAFLSTFRQFFRVFAFCLLFPKMIPCSIPDILTFGWVRLDEK